MPSRDDRVDAFEDTIQLSYEWLRAFGEELGACATQASYRCLRAALHALRDHLPPPEAVALAAHLPTLLRGVYFEGWSPGRELAPLESVEEVYDEIAEELEGGPHAAPRDVLRAALAVLNERVDAAEIRRLREIAGEELRRIWPEPPREPSALEPVAV